MQIDKVRRRLFVDPDPQQKQMNYSPSKAKLGKISMVQITVVVFLFIINFLGTPDLFVDANAFGSIICANRQSKTTSLFTTFSKTR
jgi:hypothetical protein